MKFHLACLGPVLGLVAGVVSHAAHYSLADHTFTVPDGFEVEWAATSDLVPRPVSGSFDDHGRLYVTDSSGSNEPPEIQLKNPDHRVMRLEDMDGDGIYDRSVVFADQVMFPEGCLWHDGSVYVCAPPSIWRFTDTDGDGVADRREEWFQGGTLTGCANDLHGPYLGPDGYIYWTKGAFAEQTHKLGNGRILKDKAAHIYRARPDGSDLDVIMSGGMDNPVEVAFTPEGEAIFTSTFIDFSQPGYRDGMAHAVYGGVFGKIHDVIEDGRVKRTGPEVLAPFHQAGPSAICGLHRYESSVFGDEYRDNVFATSFNLRKVTRHILRSNGATYASADSEFLVSDNSDFHPTDVLEDGDGSLLVIDTGGWYKLCCPSSQLAKPDVLGGIYRVRKKDALKLEDPNGLKLAWTRMSPAELTDFLGDPRPVVRNRVIHELAGRGDVAVHALSSVLATSGDLKATQGAVFALGRIGTLDAVDRIWESMLENAACGVTDPTALSFLRQTKLKMLGIARAVPPTEAAALALERALASDQAGLRRVAAEAAGRMGDVQRTASLLRSVAGWGVDPIVAHSATYALIELNEPKLLRAELARYGGDRLEERRRAGGRRSDTAGSQASFAQVQIAALTALDQMDARDLRSEDVTPLLGASDAGLRETAAWVAGHHPGWGGALAGFFRERLDAEPAGDLERERLERQLGQFAGEGAIQQLMAEVLAGSGTSAEVRRLLLRAMAATNLKAVPEGWIQPVLSCLDSNHDVQVRSAVAAARALAQVKTNPPDFSIVLTRIGMDESRSIDLRLEALGAVSGGLKFVEPGLLRFLCSNLDTGKPVSVRGAAASILAKAKLTEAQLRIVTDAIPAVGPLEVRVLLAAFGQETNEALGLKLMAALKESTGLAGLWPDTLKAVAAKYPDTVQAEGEALIALLNVDAGQQQQRLEELLVRLPKGDIRGGQAVFNSEKTACATCHKIGYVGGVIGPDLTSIGQARTERDLLEAIVYPSASFVRSYEPFIVTTHAEEYSGVLRSEAAEEIRLATGPSTEVRVPRSDIIEMRPGQVSVMPGGLDEQLTEQELADLIAFLKGTKWGAN